MSRIIFNVSLSSSEMIAFKTTSQIEIGQNWYKIQPETAQRLNFF
uniref:Uncharacterized protein n=1 Tax=Moniliophthora roreri TaxID=221103 RepID=A0A0W0F2R4_MONRR